MKISILPLLLLSACAAAPQPAAVETVPPEAVDARFDAGRVRSDLVDTARQRFGSERVEEALAASAYLFAKHYVGLAPPPIVQPDGSFKYPDPPMKMLMRSGAQWLVATVDGWRPAGPEKAAAIDSILRDPAFWQEPPWAQPGCTDAGGSLLMLKSSPRREIVRQGACGATARTERLVFLALEA